MTDTLLERLRRATGPDRNLDAEIAVAVGVRHRSRRTAGGKNKGREWLVDTESGGVECWSHHPPAYTASLDAAMALVPEGWSREIASSAASNFCRAEIWDPSGPRDQNYVSRRQDTREALALCIAALQARNATDPKP